MTKETMTQPNKSFISESNQIFYLQIKSFISRILFAHSTCSSHIRKI